MIIEYQKKQLKILKNTFSFRLIQVTQLKNQILGFIVTLLPLFNTSPLTVELP